MESTILLTSPLGFSPKTPPTCLPSQLHINQVSSTRPTYFVLPSQLRVKTTCHRGLNRFGSGYLSLSFGAGDSRPVRKNLQSVLSSGDNSGSAGEDVIILNVGGMMCGGCADSVKRILESQPQVSSASVELTTETAIVCPVSEAKVTTNWQQQLGEALAKHLTTCGFASSVQG